MRTEASSVSRLVCRGLPNHQAGVPGIAQAAPTRVGHCPASSKAAAACDVLMQSEQQLACDALHSEQHDSSRTGCALQKNQQGSSEVRCTCRASSRLYERSAQAQWLILVPAMHGCS